MIIHNVTSILVVCTLLSYRLCDFPLFRCDVDFALIKSVTVAQTLNKVFIVEQLAFEGCNATDISVLYLTVSTISIIEFLIVTAFTLFNTFSAGMYFSQTD